MRKNLRLSLEDPESPPSLPDLSLNPPPLSVYSLVVKPRHPRAHPTWDGATLYALADGHWMPSQWREYNGEAHPGDTIRTASAFAGYADVLADIACATTDGPAEHHLYDWNDEGDYWADPVIVQRMGDDLVWLINRNRFPTRVRFNHAQFGATVLAGVRRALELGVATDSCYYDSHRSHVESHFRDAEARLAARFGQLPVPALLSELPAGCLMFDSDTPSWLRIHHDFPPTDEPYAEFFPEHEGMATDESVYVARRVMDALAVHIRKRVPAWTFLDAPLPPALLNKLVDALDSLHEDTPRWSGAWVFYWDDSFVLPTAGSTDHAIVTTRMSLLVRDLAEHLRRFAKAGRTLHVTCD